MLRGAFQIANQALKQIDQCLDLVVAHARQRQFIAGINGLIRAGAVEPIGSGYVPLSALAEADGWILVPADSEGYPPGAEVVVRPFL